MKKYIVIVVIFAVILALAGSIYVLLNLQSHKNIETIDQSQVDDNAVLEQIKNNTQQSDQTDTQQPTEKQAAKVKSGQFVRFDPAHYANGEAAIYETESGPILSLENFSTPNGPDLFVYLVTETNISGIKSDRGESVSLGELKKIEGDQVYSLPEDYKKYGSVVIWCRAFDINFSAATLN